MSQKDSLTDIEIFPTFLGDPGVRIFGNKIQRLIGIHLKSRKNRLTSPSELNDGRCAAGVTLAIVAMVTSSTTTTTLFGSDRRLLFPRSSSLTSSPASLSSDSAK